MTIEIQHPTMKSYNQLKWNLLLFKIPYKVSITIEYRNWFDSAINYEIVDIYKCIRNLFHI